MSKQPQTKKQTTKKPAVKRPAAKRAVVRKSTAKDRVANQAGDLLKLDLGTRVEHSATSPTGTHQRTEARMTYTLQKLAPGSYDVLLNGNPVAALVRSRKHDSYEWILELLNPASQPAPFTSAEHRFETMEDARRWLGDAELVDAGTGAPAKV